MGIHYTNLTFTVASSVFRNARAGVVCAATTNDTGSSIQACVIGLTNMNCATAHPLQFELGYLPSGQDKLHAIECFIIMYYL